MFVDVSVPVSVDGVARVAVAVAVAAAAAVVAAVAADGALLGEGSQYQAAHNTRPSYLPS